MVVTGVAEDRAAILPYTRLPELAPLHIHTEDGTLQSLSKRWLILNIRRGSHPKAEVTHMPLFRLFAANCDCFERSSPFVILVANEYMHTLYKCIHTRISGL
jgi:hypothetical protein